MPPKKKTTSKKKAGTKKAPLVIPPDNKLPVLAATKNSVLVNTIAFADPHSLSRLVAHYDYAPVLTTVDVNGSTPIHIAVKKNDSKMVQQLVNYHKINLDALEIHAVGGQSALHQACISGNTTIIEILLKAGANPNIKSNSTIGETPLQLCCKIGNIICAKLLIKSGANTEIKDNFGNNTTFWASKYQQDGLIRELGLPSIRTPNAEEFLALLIKQNPKFSLPTVKIKGKGKTKDNKGGKKK